MKIFLLCCALIFSNFTMEKLNAQSQKETTTKTRKFIYTYTFENASSEEIIQKAQTTLSGLLHVSEVKYHYKKESFRGEFIITVIEKDRTSESEKLFSPSMIKSTLLENGISPIQFEVTEEILK